MKVEAQKKTEPTENSGEKKQAILIKKIKYSEKDETIEIHYTKYVGANESKETIYKSTEEPTQDWFTPFHKLLEELFGLLELPEEYLVNTEMRGITISEGDGVTLTAVKKFPDLDNKAFCINSPHLPMYQAQNDKECATLPNSTVKTIETLIEETKLYMSGKRKHTQLKIVKTCDRQNL